MEHVCAIVDCGAPATTMVPVGGLGSPMIRVCAACQGRVAGPDHRQRTIDGLARARAAGRVGGNPLVLAGDLEHIARLSAIRKERHRERILAESASWLPIVLELRPRTPWWDVTRAIEQRTGQTWPVERLRRTIKKLVEGGHVEAGVMDRAPIPTRSNGGC